MKGKQRGVGAFVVATIIVTTITLTPAPADAHDLAGFCTILKDGIARLQAKPESRLQQYLLSQALRVYDLYCR